GFAGKARPDLATLIALHRAHLQAIPYDSLDVQLGRPVSLDPGAAFEKIGFKVTRMAGAAMRELRGDSMLASHLVLLVESDELPGGPWIADVGFGDGALEPFPLAEGPLSFEG